MEPISIQYRFTLADGTQEVFDLRLQRQPLELSGPGPEDMPAWTKLDFHQCPNCPLTIASHPHCPVAVNLVAIVQSFEKLLSYDQLHLEVITEERTISQDTSAQRAISSLMGLVIAASGCPHTAFLRPMARFHLPLASEEETICRATSMYLLAQYFLKNEGKQTEFGFAGLTKSYKAIQIVNLTITERLRVVSETDSSVNALILLDMYAKAMPYVIDESLEEVRYVFDPFFMVSQTP